MINSYAYVDTTAYQMKLYKQRFCWSTAMHNTYYILQAQNQLRAS